MEQDFPALLRSLKGHKQSITAMDMHPKCRFIASAGVDSNFMLWDIKDQAQPRRFEGHKTQIQDLKFHPNGLILASAASDGAIKFWDLLEEGKQVTITKAHNAKIRSINYSCDGNLLVSAADDKNIKIWSTLDRRLQDQYKKHNNWVRYCQFSPISQSLISCDDRFVYIWDVQTKKVVQEYKEHSGVIHQAKFHSLGNIAASCSHDKKIKIYDIRSRKVVQVYDDHKGAVKSIDFHPHTSHIISSADDGTTKIWNFQTSSLEYTIQSPSNVTKFSKQGEYFITAGVQKSVNLWKSGFYDNFKEKIDGHGPTTQSNIGKVTVENRKKQKKNKTEQSDQFGNTAAKISDEDERNVDKNLLYCHEKQNFEFFGNQNQTNIVKSKKDDKNFQIPKSLLRKISQMNSQLDFITKTTQILEARVLNNGEQLQRLINMAQIGSQETYEEQS